MGLTHESTGKNVFKNGVNGELCEDKYLIGLAGNPNVGKSTVFNYLTGLNQHTGNWPGKTVTNAQGTFNYNEKKYAIVDIPGTYSLMSHSKEEEIARDFICFSKPDAMIVVCDATCLERNMNLVLQTLEITSKVIVCVNLIDEAKKKKIEIDYKNLELKLGVPVVGISAKTGEGMDNLLKKIEEVTENDTDVNQTNTIVSYSDEIEKSLKILEPVLKSKIEKPINLRWLSLRLIDADESFLNSINNYLGTNIDEDTEIMDILNEIKLYLNDFSINSDTLKDLIVSKLVITAEEICKDVIYIRNKNYNLRDRKIDKILTSKKTGIPLMVLLLGLIFWITIIGANYPSEFLSNFFLGFESNITKFCIYIGMPSWLYGILVQGIYKVLTWVVSVMLPPMAIFFPLFTFLEDIGYLPRIAFNLDKYFKKCCACGKQSLTMCMGFGCNSAGVIGCRIIDSERERMIAILTNNFVPCNGRFPQPHKEQQNYSFLLTHQKKLLN